MELTRDQLASRKEKAVRFTRDVLGDPERAEEIEGESLEDYAERRHIRLTNTNRRNGIMGRAKTKADLEQEISDLQEENQELQDQLDAVAEIVAPEDDESEDSEDDGDDDGDDEEEGDDPE
jgi:hypothetical protein